MEPFSVGGQNTPAKCHCKFGSDETGQCYQNLTLMGFNRSPEKCHIHSTEQQCNADKDWCKWHKDSPNHDSFSVGGQIMNM